VIDSSSKVSSGLLEGNIVDLGNFDECVSINVNEEWGSFQGQHCLISTKINSQRFTNIPLWWSICLPSTCNISDLLQHFTTAINHTIEVRPMICFIEEAKPFSPAYWIAMVKETITYSFFMVYKWQTTF
ncbi:hypothetical protein C0J52_18235, partial [Blattella germanica]